MFCPILINQILGSRYSIINLKSVAFALTVRKITEITMAESYNMDIELELIIQTAEHIVSGEHNQENDVLLMESYIRQNIENLHNMIIPNVIVHICQFFLGSMTLIIIDKLKSNICRLDNHIKDFDKLCEESKLILIQIQVCEETKANKIYERIHISSHIHEQTKQIARRLLIVEEQMAAVKNGVKIAKESVKLITKNQIYGLKALKHPPLVVEMTLNAVADILDTDGTSAQKEKVIKKLIIQQNGKRVNNLICGFIRLSVGVLMLDISIGFIVLISTFVNPKDKNLGTNVPVIRYSFSWPYIQRMLMSKQFMKKVLKFDISSITSKKTTLIQHKYSINDNFFFDKVNMVSKVAGTFVLWVQSVLEFWKMMDCTYAVRKEIGKLKHKRTMNRKTCKKLKRTIPTLDKEIQEYNVKYQTLTLEISKKKPSVNPMKRTTKQCRSLLGKLKNGMPR